MLGSSAGIDTRLPGLGWRFRGWLPGRGRLGRALGRRDPGSLRTPGGDPRSTGLVGRLAPFPGEPQRSAARALVGGHVVPAPGDTEDGRSHTPELSLIHISEPTRLGMISYAV